MKANSQVKDSSKKQTNEFVFTSMRRVLFIFWRNPWPEKNVSRLSDLYYPQKKINHINIPFKFKSELKSWGTRIWFIFWALDQILRFPQPLWMAINGAFFSFMRQNALVKYWWLNFSGAKPTTTAFGSSWLISLKSWNQMIKK